MPTCQSCGAPLEADARFCPQCAAPVGDQPRQPGDGPDQPSDTPAASTDQNQGDVPAPTAFRSGLNEQNWAVFAHLSALVPLLVGVPLTFLGPLVLWLLLRERGPIVRDQATEALNFNISWLVWGLVLLIAGAVLSIPTVGIAIFPALVLLAALGIAWLILVIVAAVRAASGETYRYPLTIRFITD